MPADRLSQPLVRARSRKILGYLAASVLILAVVLFLGRALEGHLQALDDWFASLGAWGIVPFLVVLVLGTSLLLPASLFGIAAGVLFGLAGGLMACFGGHVVAASLQYALARRLLLARIERTLAARPSLAALQRAVLRQEFRLQLLVRLAPINPATFRYLLGAAGVRFGGFLLATVGLLPHLALEVYLGHAGRHVAGLVTDVRGTSSSDVEVFGGLAVAVVVVALVSRATHRAVTAAVARSGGSGNQ